jgi:hypothetical protein
LVITDAMFSSNLERIAELTLKYRLPAIYDRSAFVEAGGLLSYGANLAELSRRAAEYVDQIFKGAKPEDLTLVQPDEIRSFDQSQDCPTDWRHHSAQPACTGRSDNEMTRRDMNSGTNQYHSVPE